MTDRKTQQLLDDYSKSYDDMDEAMDNMNLDPYNEKAQEEFIKAKLKVAGTQWGVATKLKVDHDFSKRIIDEIK